AVQTKRPPLVGDRGLFQVAPGLAVVADLPNVALGPVGQAEWVIAVDLQDGAELALGGESNLPPPFLFAAAALPARAWLAGETVAVDGAGGTGSFARAGGRGTRRLGVGRLSVPYVADCQKNNGQ